MRVTVLVLLCASVAHAQSPADGVEGLSPERGKIDLRVKVEHAITDTTSFLLRPWDLFLQPLPDGVYRYRGTDFDAEILADGSVRYREKGEVRLGLVQRVKKDGTPASKPMPAISFGDPVRWLEKWKGNDIHAAERKRFLDKTRQLREQLHDAYQRRVFENADKELLQRLFKIADDADRMGSERAQEAIFTLWDRCADDAVGDRVRDDIERFIRERCVPGEACEFTPDAVARVNAQRHSKRAFDPYRVDARRTP